MTVTNDIKYVGVNDKDIDLFEGQYTVPLGMAYNSYVILDEKIAVLDTVSEGFGDEWLSNIKGAIGDREPSYLIIQHMEPDHSANIINFMNAYPKAVIVASAKAFTMIKNFFGKELEENRLVVGEGSRLSLGVHELVFLTAPMVHWPEVVVTYDAKDKVLFSADAFGKFGALDVEDEWACEARRYYFGIVGKYGKQAEALLKKAAALDIRVICPLHGPVLSENLPYYLDLYSKWASYTPEDEGVVIAYASVYGNTAKAASLLAERLEENSCKVSLIDLARCDMAEAVEDAFRYSKLVLASVTYNGDVFPVMRQFIDALKERNYQNRTLAFIENGSWAPMAAKVMKSMLEGSQNLNCCENVPKITSSLNEESRVSIEALAQELLQK